ncbi:MAG: disulfide bond formation protein B [Janthinobacterium lividum]
MINTLLIQNSKLKLALWISFLFGAGSLISGKIIQHFYHVKPCALCIYQQIALGAIGFFGLIALITWRKSYHTIIAVIVLALVAINFGIATYHVGVEQHIFPVMSQCHGNLGPHHTGVEALRDLLLETNVVPCDKVKWSFLGLSMASYNMLLSAIVLLFWIGVLKSRRKFKTEGF